MVLFQTLSYVSPNSNANNVKSNGIKVLCSYWLEESILKNKKVLYYNLHGHHTSALLQCFCTAVTSVKNAASDLQPLKKKFMPLLHDPLYDHVPSWSQRSNALDIKNMLS